MSLPAQLDLVPAQLAQVHIGRSTCEGASVSNHKIQVDVWWKPSAIVEVPTHGFALGAVSGATTKRYEDTVKSFVVGSPDNARLIGTLNRIIIQHTFPKSDKTDAGSLVLGVWAVDADGVASNFYIGDVKWD